jgi:hypothetical protein
MATTAKPLQATPPVKSATESDQQQVIATIVLAFDADPMVRWMYQQPSQYLTSWPDFVQAFGGRAFEHGTAHYVEGYAGAALWLPPGAQPDEEALASVIQRTIDPGARMFIAGTWGPSDYMRELFRHRERLGVQGVAFTGPISDAGLVALYESSDMLLCLSEHEGFGVPLLEAMGMGIPVVAYDAGAVAETLGGAGVLVRTLDPAVVAEAVGGLICDEALRAQVVDRQHARVAEVTSAPREDVLLDVVRRAGERNAKP